MGLEISWNSWEAAEEDDGEYFVHSQENHGEMEGGCEDLGEYPSDHNPLTPLDPVHHSLDHTSEMGEAQGEVE